MNRDIFAEWLRRQGHHIVRTESSYWFDQGPHVYQAFPYHWLIHPSNEELECLLKKNRIVGARYSTSIADSDGAASYHVVCYNKDYSLKSVKVSSRSAVRRGLESCKIRHITLAQYAEEGWKIQRETEIRQGRGKTIGREAWVRKMMSAKGLDGFEVWGAFVGGHLAATIFGVQIDDCFNILYQQSLRLYLPLRVNNALTYETTRELIGRSSVRMLHYGLQSLDAPPSVDKYKLAMGWSLRPVRQRVVFNLAVPRPVVTYMSKILRMGRALLPKNYAIRKAEGFTRFYANSNLPLRNQELSELLIPFKGELYRMSENPDSDKIAIVLDQHLAAKGIRL
jgi:hypothetical protein